MTDSKPSYPNQPTDDDTPDRREPGFRVSSSARSILRRLHPEEVERARRHGTNPFTTDPTDPHDRIDLSELDEPVAESLGDDPDTALHAIEEKMAQVTQELTEGQINQAQFQALYTHYAEQKTLILRLLSRDPHTDAWQRAASEGYTGILRKRHAARLEGLAIYDNWTGGIIRVFGTVDVPERTIAPLLESLRDRDTDLPEQRRPLSTQIEGGRWLSYYRGTFVTVLGVYSAEPSAVQLIQQANLHEQFEKVNHNLLEIGYADADDLAYPQQALFDDNPR